MSKQEKTDFFKTIESLKKYFGTAILKESPDIMPLKAWVRRRQLLDKGETCFTGEDSIKQAWDMKAYLRPLKTVVHNPQSFGYTILQCTDWDARLEFHRQRIHKNIDNYLFPEDKKKVIQDYLDYLHKSHSNLMDIDFLPFPGMLEYHRPPESDREWAMRMGLKMEMEMKFDPGPFLA